MTEKQNYMMLLSGRQPEWVPHFMFGPSPLGKPAPQREMIPSFLMSHFFEPGPAKDIWGVTHVPAVGAKVPEPNNFILDDIRRWRDVIKAPDLSGYDWEALAKRDLDNSRIDRNETAVTLGLFVGFFQSLASFMGFTEALCAMCEEPEEVKALMEYLCDFYCTIAENCIDYYNPDIFNITDDTATWSNSFFSLEMYRELIKPYATRLASYGVNRGLPIEMHNCGRCEDFIDDWMDFGVVSWNPAQTSNDLLAVKRKYGNKIVINGGWDILGELADDEVSEETVKNSIYAAIDSFAPGGGYAFCGGFLGSYTDEKTAQKNKWIAEAVDSYGKSFYK